jgi:hypothetical protein
MPAAVVITETMLLYRIVHGSTDSETPTCRIFINLWWHAEQRRVLRVCVCAQVLCVNRDVSRELCYSSVKEDHKASLLQPPRENLSLARGWRDSFEIRA